MAPKNTMNKTCLMVIEVVRELAYYHKVFQHEDCNHRPPPPYTDHQDPINLNILRYVLLLVEPVTYEQEWKCEKGHEGGQCTPIFHVTAVQSVLMRCQMSLCYSHLYLTELRTIYVCFQHTQCIQVRNTREIYHNMKILTECLQCQPAFPSQPQPA